MSSPTTASKLLPRRPGGTSGLPSKVIVLFMLAAIGVFAWRKLAPPPSPATPQEVYAAQVQSAPAIDHGPFELLLRAFVRDGRVDYVGLKARSDELDAYLRSLAEVNPQDHSRDQLLAMYLNAYNAATLRLILDYHPVASIKDIPEARRWADRRWTVGGEMVSLDGIEHEVLRSRFIEPRIHFALVCASKGCPVLRPEAYTAEKLNAQLADQVRQAHRDPRWLKWDESTKILELTPLYEWFRRDFERGGGTVLDFVAEHCDPELAASLKRSPGAVQLRSLDWDWSLNGQ